MSTGLSALPQSVNVGAFGDRIKALIAYLMSLNIDWGAAAVAFEKLITDFAAARADGSISFAEYMMLMNDAIAAWKAIFNKTPIPTPAV